MLQQNCYFTKSKNRRTLSKNFREFFFVLNHVSKSILLAEIDVEIRKAFRYRPSKRLIAKWNQLLIVRPFTFAFLPKRYSFIHHSFLYMCEHFLTLGHPQLHNASTYWLVAGWPDSYITFQSLAVYFIENLPRSIKMAKVGTKVGQIPNQNHTKYVQRLKILPKYRNFANSGHTRSTF